jgi:Na+/H+ antiporter NhaC
MITLVILTRKVLLSLGVGVLLAAFIYSSYNPIDAVVYIATSFWGIITDFGWYMPILGFVVLIGGITSIITLIGGVNAFAKWAVSKIKNPIAAQIMTWILGLIIMIDDYFNALVIGEVTKPITDQYRISRAKLAYIIDSTSAPVVVLMPISTWGAYIIGSIGGLFVKSGITDQSGLEGFLSAIPFQFYPISAIVVVFLIIRFKIRFGPMKKMEDQAEVGEDTSKLSTELANKVTVEGTKATQWSLIAPILLLLLMTFFMMLVSAGFDFAEIMNQDITVPLFVGGLSAFALAVIFGFFDKSVKPKSMARVASKGIFGMAKSAGAILILAWMVSNAIQDLGTGDLIADVVASSDIAHAFLPFVLFLIAGGMAFATGTSWGSFGILLPIAIPVALATDPAFMPAIIAAVLGGAVFGDHSSPVSDTTVLSAAGARSTLHSHFVTQLPYAALTAGIAAIGYLAYGITESLIVSYLVIAVLLFLFVKFWKVLLPKAKKA